LVNVRIAICIVTYRRPGWLTGCLQSLSQLIIEGSTEIVIIVVDNDPEGGSRGIVEAAQARSPWSVVYEIEREQGISFARNRAVRAALGQGVDLIAFMDDDEIADPRWLVELLAVRQRFAADVVSGPVLPLYEAGVPKWAVRGRFFERPRYRTGTHLESARTGNCLLDSNLLAGVPVPFDPAFALSGGSDTHFFRKAHRQGASIVWADKAIVHERVPQSRASVRWLLQRAYRGGACFAVSERMEKQLANFPVRLFTGMARVLLGMLLLVPSLLLGKAGVVRALQTAFVGAGLLSGLCGVLYYEYLVVHGE
jgi:succinoglycan biosynthesis protein ExoM